MTGSFRYLLMLRRLVAIGALPIALMACTAQVRVAAPPVYEVPRPAPPPATAVVAEPAPGVVIRAYEAPPELPVYVQPACPGDGFLWTPGYWAWGDAGYYWVPGTWVRPPRVGLLWTPGYWGFVGGAYVFHAGYWGAHVGFYGGINYGFGYVGVGFAGGRWVGNSFAYNRSVTHISTTVVIHNTYDETVVNNVNVNRVSYNGGSGGVRAVPTAQERLAAREPHLSFTAQQVQHIRQAARIPELAARANGGHPAIAATPRPSAFHAAGVVGARDAAPRREQLAGRSEQPHATERGARGLNRPRVAHDHPRGQKPHRAKPHNKRGPSQQPA